MLTTSQLRTAWAPACTGPFARVTLNGGGVVSVRPAIVPAVLALDSCLRAHRYAATPPDVGAFNCRKITGGTGYSLHAFGIAMDLNWQDNGYGPVLRTDMTPAMVAAIKAIRTRSGAQVWRWGGDYTGNKDGMHYEVVCSPSELATGIDPRTVPGAAPAVRPTPRAPSAPAGSPAIRLGASGPRVAALQYALNYATGARLLGDGDFGPSTEQAVKNLQSRFKLSADGIYGPASQWVLQTSCDAKFSAR